MKLSLHWIADHLNLDWKKIDTEKLVAYFNTHVAEIEFFYPTQVPVKELFLAKLQAIESESVALFIPEIRKKVDVAPRPDASVGSFYLLKEKAGAYQWATHQDMGGSKEALLPAFNVTDKEALSWKKELEVDDIILDVDNKSITHRPDLWSHRGFAREVARFLKARLVPEKKLLIAIPVKEAGKAWKATKQLPVAVSLTTDACKRFSFGCVEGVSYTPSSLFRALRLLRVDMRAIDAIVDATNYVMLDIGQPMHAFDAGLITSRCIEPRQARAGEKLTLLGGTELILDPQDLVISGGDAPLALAGIKGGQYSGVSAITKSLFLEAATFDAATIRRAAFRHKLRTESSARFEKSLDTHATVPALERFLKLLKEDGVSYTKPQALISLGTLPKPLSVKTSQVFIEEALGLQFKKGEVKKLLESIGFKVAENSLASGTLFTIQVPSYRATKDISQPEDIVEEVGRLYGYTALQEELPVFSKQPIVSKEADTLFLIKNFLAHSAQMHELSTYNLVDQEFVNQFAQGASAHRVELANPLVEQKAFLVDDLMVQLLQVVAHNKADNESLRLFEYAREWHKGHADRNVVETRVLAGLVYHRKEKVDFYKTKDVLIALMNLLGLPCQFRKQTDGRWWQNPYAAAQILCDGIVVGSLASVSAVALEKIGGGDAVGFLLDIDALMACAPEQKKYVPLPKYQSSHVDVSALFPLSVSVDEIRQGLRALDERVQEVQLWDMFSKPEWKDERSLTFRCVLRDPEGVIPKQDTDLFLEKASGFITKKAGVVR